jgi:hypothetical protein
LRVRYRPGKGGQYTSGSLIFALLLTFQLVSVCQ